MNPSQSFPVVQLQRLLQLAAKYQFAISGEFNISRHRLQCEIDNDTFSKVGLQCVSSKRLDFDGGIELEFCGIDELSDIFIKHNLATFTARIYNLHDDSELESFLIKDKEDCEFICVCSSNTFADNTEPSLAEDLENYWNGNRVGKIRTFTALKLG